MTRPALHFRGLRFERTLDSAFKTPRYADPIEHFPPSSLWRRFINWLCKE
jgi:hypothetical protein